jgi:transcriptional regulator GlxA family with amidase domain
MYWIDAHLHQPITLTSLERCSGYGRRTLQLAFQERCGCAPMQWVRSRRLELARQALLQPCPSDTMGGIAAQFCFASLAAFSSDFVKAFGQRLSDLLRLSRRIRY